MKITILPIVLLLALTAGADEIRQFDAALLGQRITSPVKLMSDDPGEVLPSSIQVDLKDGKIYAATVNYPSKITLAEATNTLNRTYAKWRRIDPANSPDIALWRNEEKGFSIQLTKEDGSITARYVSFKK